MNVELGLPDVRPKLFYCCFQQTWSFLKFVKFWSFPLIWTNLQGIYDRRRFVICGLKVYWWNKVTLTYWIQETSYDKETLYTCILLFRIAINSLPNKFEVHKKWSYEMFRRVLRHIEKVNNSRDKFTFGRLARTISSRI